MRGPGLYVHVPFCRGKCPYCDFYSLRPDEKTVMGYIRRTLELMGEYGRDCPLEISTVYLGGGTPSLLGAGRLGALLEGAAGSFSILPGAEITCEANPTGVDREFFRGLRAAGFNRLSMGMQSADPAELRLLGRSHSPKDVERAVEAARGAGFSNISLDLMLALPGGTERNLEQSIRFAAGLGVEHISSYILKVENGTPFASMGLALPDEDEAADQYLFAVELLGELGYAQYEISSFSRPGYESRHNLCYWRCDEYLGLGPGAHSFYKGRRFYWERDLEGYLLGGAPVDDGPGGGRGEFAMLNLRLARGLRRDDCTARFGDEGAELFARIGSGAARLPGDLVTAGRDRIAFTPKGFLVSNALLSRLLEGVL